MEVITNDLERSAVEIAALYKRHGWDIELLFRWIKQHLKLRARLHRPVGEATPSGCGILAATHLPGICAADMRAIKELLSQHSLGAAATSPNSVGQCLFIRKSIDQRSTDRPMSMPVKPKPTVPSRTIGVRLCLNIPGQPCVKAGMTTGGAAS